MEFPASPHCRQHATFRPRCTPCNTAYDSDPRVIAYRDAVRADCNTPDAATFFAARGEANPIASITVQIASD